MKVRFKPKYNIKKGDLVVVIAGDDKNLSNPKPVLAVDIEKGKVLVEGVAIAKRHLKPTAQNTTGQIVEQEAYISISNVMLWDEKLKVPSKTKRTRINGKLVRISKKSGEIIK